MLTSSDVPGFRFSFRSHALGLCIGVSNVYAQHSKSPCIFVLEFFVCCSLDPVKPQGGSNTRSSSSYCEPLKNSMADPDKKVPILKTQGPSIVAEGMFDRRCEDSRLNQGYHSLLSLPYLSGFIFYLKMMNIKTTRPSQLQGWDPQMLGLKSQT